MAQGHDNVILFVQQISAWPLNMHYSKAIYLKQFKHLSFTKSVIKTSQKQGNSKNTYVVKFQKLGRFFFTCLQNRLMKHRWALEGIYSTAPELQLKRLLLVEINLSSQKDGPWSKASLADLKILEGAYRGRCTQKWAPAHVVQIEQVELGSKISQ